tara:strand:- start:631 stop:1065 length:435 start_codon:yes stop_codon:yes gene_type:complete
MNKINIAIGCDHAGYELKQKVIERYSSKYNFINFGTNTSKSVDYPIYGHKVGISVSNGEALMGIVICGSGIGISISANKIKGIRAALCSSKEHAKLSRLHNNANVLAFGSRLTEEEEVFDMIDVFLSTAFEGGRHQDRLEKIEI